MGNEREKVWGIKEVDDWGGGYMKRSCQRVYISISLRL